ncbi:hypothetical protein [Spirosoma panaciterrae]|uniref:hypothetical protein n=1 Tax=Spirosoma panaciterrae TaxID=496058 RepID=UPI000381B93C|nr:hypothetical protein [Spirosoma panaciterrae]
MKNYVSYPYKRPTRFDDGGVTPYLDEASSGLSSAVEGAMSGAALGPVGAIAGGLIGFFSGQAKGKAEADQRAERLRQQKEADYTNKLALARTTLSNYPVSGMVSSPFLMGEGGPVKGRTLAEVNVRGKRNPIVVNDPNDPRLRAYRDSLALYEKGRAFKARFYNEPVFNTNREAADFSFALRQEASDLIRKSRIKPVSYQGLPGVDQPNGTYTVGWEAPVYKKPTQPVLFDKVRRHINYVAEPIILDRKIASPNLLDRIVPLPVQVAEPPESTDASNKFVSPPQNNGELYSDYVRRVHDLRVKYTKSKMGKGGYLPHPLYKAEGGEVIQHAPYDIPQTDSRGTTEPLSSNTSLIIGDKHSAPSGGIGMSNTQPARIFSDQLLLPAHLEAQLALL